jgi:hypothetical protein
MDLTKISAKLKNFVLQSEKCNLLNQRSQEIKCSSFTKTNSSNIRARQKQRTKVNIGFTKSRMAKINVDASPKANKIKHSLHQKQQIGDMRFTKSNRSN